MFSTIVLFSILYIALFLYLYFAVIIEDAADKKLKKQSGLRQYFPYIIILAILFVAEVLISGTLDGHQQDTGLFRAWTSFGLEHKMNEYYKTDLYVDYPPVYLMILYGLGRIAHILGIEPHQNGYLALIKLVPILCDYVFVIFIFALAKEHMSKNKAFSLASFVLFNPSTIVNSAVWGQVDSFVLLITLAMLFTLYNKNYILACALFALSILTKPQMIIFAPLLGFTILFDFVETFKDKKQRNKMIKQIISSVLVAVAVLLIVPLPVTGFNYKLLIEKYLSAMGMYQYATLNAANLYGAFGLNWAKLSETFKFVDARTWGFFFIALTSVLVGVVSYKIKNRNKIFYLGAFTVASIYMFAHTMHERYLFALMPLLLVIYIFTKDKRMLFLYGGFSLTNFINVSNVLAKAIKNQFIYGNNIGFILLSWLHLILFASMVWFGYEALFKKDIQAEKNIGVNVNKKGINKPAETTYDPWQKPVETKVGRIDVLVIAGLMLFYSVFAFYNLGSNNVPENGWYCKDASENVVVDLGEPKDIKQVYAYSGWIDRRKSDHDVKREIKIECSIDGTTWTDAEKMELASVWCWKATAINEKARYIRFIPDDARFYINELAFFGDTEKDKYIPVGASGSGTASALIDEQDKVPYEFSWYDGTYFDEIYHPRTAYEHLTHRYPYENTHPPLGKLIISAGIALFGMNPFGWRFFGALCGVLMVPFAYMLGKSLFKQTFFAFVAAFIFTFDFMHLSQTRLATIDSYTALFVMGMYYFMYQYINKSFYRDGFCKTLRPLLLSGIFFGLGAATKWQGVYAGTGLAFLFFYNLWHRYREYLWVRKNRPRQEGAQEIINGFKPMAIKTVICGALFFVVLPIVIYFISYIPAMMTPDTGLKFFFSNQFSMFFYHSSLTSNHPYGSQWWSWPLDLRPLYAYSPNRSFIPKGMQMGISSFGNPIIWWLTIPVILGAIVKTIRKKGNKELTFILAGFLSMYLPWVLVPRVAFIYHFFPCVIFVVLGIVYFMKELTLKSDKAKWYIYSYLLAVFVLFVLFYPVLTGMIVPTSYVEGLKWLPTWVLG